MEDISLQVMQTLSRLHVHCKAISILVSSTSNGKWCLWLADAQHLFVKIPSVYSKNYAHGKALLGFVGV